MRAAYVIRFLLPPQSTESRALALTQDFRSIRSRPAKFSFRSLRGSPVRRQELKAFQDADASIIDVVSTASEDQLKDSATRVLSDGFLLRIVDDQELDVCYPSVDWLATSYPNVDLSWLLDPEELPIPWVTTVYYAFPSNPPTWDETVPIMASLLSTVHRGEPRPCPYCSTIYVSRGERGQCPTCGGIAQPFDTIEDAKQIVRTPLDAFGWGRCGRCRMSVEFDSMVEQCHRCGRLLQAAPHAKMARILKDNVERVGSLLKQLP